MVSMCRLCASLKKAEYLTFIRDSNHDLCHQLTKCCQITIDAKDILPKGVCQECIRSLNNAFEFYERVHESQQSLKQLLNVGNTTTKTTNNDETTSKDRTSLALMAVAVSTGIDDKLEETPPIANDNTDDEVTRVIEEILGVKHESRESLNQDSENEENEQEPEIDTEEEISQNNAHILVPDSLADIEFIEEDVSELDFDAECYEIVEEEEEEECDQEEEVPPANSPNAIDETEYAQENLPVQLITYLPEKDAPSDTWLDFSWKCVPCLEFFTSPKQLIEHNENSHRIQGPDVEWFCSDCQKTYQRYHTLITHIRQRHRTHLALLCDICNDSCSSFADLEEHRKTLHSDEIDLVMFLCTTCGKGFHTMNSLHMHSKCHLPIEQRLKYACPLCEKKFPTSSNLKFHQKMHTGTRDYICDQCGKNFIQKTNLEEHLITHLNVTPYECSLCQKSFKTPERLTRHRQRHTDDKPYSCSDCDKTFRTKDAMMTHRRIHTGEMPFKCEFCAKPFRFRSTLMTHHNVHTGTRPYSCEECDHHFTNWPNYNKHMKRRHGIDVSSSTPRGKKPSKPKNALIKKDTRKDDFKQEDDLKIFRIEVEGINERENKDVADYEPEEDINITISKQEEEEEMQEDNYEDAV